jgi:hypothetical protein
MGPKSMPRTRKNGGLLASPLHHLVKEGSLRKKCLSPASTPLELSTTNSFIEANYVLQYNMTKDNIK